MSVTKDTITADELKMVELMKSLKIKPPKFETAEQLEHYMKFYVTETEATKPDVKKHYERNPKISIFYGESNKGEVQYTTWRYEVECLINSGSCSEEDILGAIRRSCKGNAGDKLRHIGTTPTLKDILKKFASEYGSVETGESILRKFYACSQDNNESISSYAARVEDLFAQGVQLKVLLSTQEEILQNVVFEGLRPHIRQMANYKFDTMKDYDRFKVELRKIENHIDEDVTKEKKTKCQAATNIEERNELSQVKTLLEKMNNRIEKLENEKEERTAMGRNYNSESNYRGNGVRGYSRGYSRGIGRSQGYQGGRGLGYNNQGDTGRGRGTYTPRRPYGSPFKPKCHRCQSEEHFIRNCPN